MFKNTRTTQRLWSCILIVVVLFVTILPAVFAQEEAAADAVAEGARSIWSRVQL